jgi:hypothetical protein
MKSVNLEKCMRVINELVAFCYNEGGADDFDISITHNPEQEAWEILLTCPMPPPEQEVLDQFQEQLNTPRQHEIENDYWELCGEAEMSGELTLAGMMIDEAEVDYRIGVLSIHAKRRD